MSLPPKVEITVEQLDGIVWCTQLRHASREELKKRVPFVTAAVEFSGTCPTMKVYSASHFPQSKHPAVESYFASLENPRQIQKAQGGNEVKKIISTTTEVGGKTTTTTTTTITTIQSSATPAIKYREGYHPLVAKWHDDSSDEKLVDSVTFFTSPHSYDDADTGTLLTQNQKQNRPHLTLTLPTAAEQHRPSFLTSMFAPCHHHHHCQSSKKNQKKHSKDVSSTLTSSTCASTTCSSGSRNHPQHLQKETNPHCQSKGKKPVVTMQDEAHVAPLVATQKSKELAATAIAAEPSSAVVGQSEASKASGIFTPLSWLTCGTAAPEIVALRVRVMPEDLDEFDDETNMSEQHPAYLEGVAHLVFLDQIIEEGTTIMNLPLKIPRQDKATKRNSSVFSAAPTLAKSEQGYVTLAPNAMLRVRVTIIPQGRRSTAQQPHRLHAFNQSELDDDDDDDDDDATSVKTQSLPGTGIPSFFKPFSMNFELFALVEKTFQAHTTENLTKKNKKVANDEDKKPKKRGPFPHEFPTVVPDEKSKKEDSSLLGDWKSSRESWGWLRFSSDNKRGLGARSSGNNLRKRNDPRHENKKFYTIPDAPNSSTDSESSDETGSVAGTAVYTMEL